MASDDFGFFFKQRERAAEEYTNGNPAPVVDLVPQDGDATFHSPGGDTVKGREAVAERYGSDAERFRPGSETELEVLQSAESGDLAFWTGFQRAKVQMAGKDEPVPMKIRVTEVFRRENGEWKMIHRHADMGKPPQ